MKKTDTAVKNGKKRLHGVISVLGLILAGLFFAMAIFVFIVTLKAKNENKVPTFFGYSFSIVVTNSMEPDIAVGELLIVKNADIESVSEGEVVVFTGLSGEVAGERIVHKVIEKGTDEEGIYLITQGINNAVPDADKVRAGNFVGISAGHSLFLGRAVIFLFRAESVLFILLLAVLSVIVVRQVKSLSAAIKEEIANDSESEPLFPPLSGTENGADIDTEI